jgi:hypothetical protein
MKHLTVFFLTLSTLCLPAALRAEGDHSFAVGANYWLVIDDIDVDNVDDNGFSYLAAYRYSGGLLSLQAEVEVFPDDYAGADAEVISPQVLLVLGDNLFAAIGIGIQSSDGEFADDPYYLIRAGISLLDLGGVQIDLHATYQFSDADGFSTDDIDTDTVTLGAMVRFDL